MFKTPLALTAILVTILGASTARFANGRKNDHDGHPERMLGDPWRA